MSGQVIEGHSPSFALSNWDNSVQEAISTTTLAREVGEYHPTYLPWYFQILVPHLILAPAALGVIGPDKSLMIISPQLRMLLQRGRISRGSPEYTLVWGMIYLA